MENVQFWPFDVLPPNQQSDHHRQEIAFLEQAFQDGFQPYVFDRSNYGGTANERKIEIIHRGADRYWELFFTMADNTVGTFYIEGFAAAGTAALEWLRGEDLSAITRHVKDSIVTKPGLHGW